MLPFLKLAKEASISTPEVIERDHDEDYDYDMLESAAEDLIQAVHSKNVKSVAEALRAAFEICDAQPHEEGPHKES